MTKDLILPITDVSRQWGTDRRRSGEVLIKVRGLQVGFGRGTILANLDLDVYRSEVLSVVGGSGTGKSILMQAILGLIPIQKGSIEAFGHEVSIKGDVRKQMGRHWGVLFQHGALYSSLTVRENIQMPMKEYFQLPQTLMDELTMLKINLVGLNSDAADKLPSELSGGMIKRASLARALALDPVLVFLDEPTSGLDPVGAAEFDDLISHLRETLGLTVYMITHDLDSIAATSDRIAALGDKKVLVTGDFETVANFDHAWTRSYFGSARARRVRSALAPKGRQ